MGTATLAVLCIVWLAAAAALCFQLIRPRTASTGSRWIVSGVLVMLSAAAASQFAHNRNWPIHRLLALDGLTMAVSLAGIGCMIAGFKLRSRAAAPARTDDDPAGTPGRT